MNTRKLAVGSAILLLVAVLTGAAMTGVFTQDKTTEEPSVSTTEIQTASAEASDDFGLLDLWQSAYRGNSSAGHDYDFDGDGSDEREQCANCHMSAESGSSKHEPALHPIGLYNGTDTGEWFFDDGEHRGPNTQLASQRSGLTVNSSDPYCGDCHTPTDASGFADPGNSGKTSDPHSVHRDVLTREGCIRCHNYDDTTFASGESWEFTQDNATRDTYGIANPINMTRAWDGKFLSTTDEATYNASLDSSGSGWNKYDSPDASNSTRYACGDCHDQYHTKGGLGFAFKDSADSRKGPLAKVNDADSIGISSGGNDFTCGECHVTDAHAVHTNGGIVTATNYSYASNTSTDSSIHNSSARGAEYCDECHSQNVGTHNNVPEELGLSGEKNNDPDALATDTYSTSSWVTTPDENDCGFCHK